MTLEDKSLVEFGLISYEDDFDRFGFGGYCGVDFIPELAAPPITILPLEEVESHKTLRGHNCHFILQLCGKS